MLNPSYRTTQLPSFGKPGLSTTDPATPLGKPSQPAHIMATAVNRPPLAGKYGKGYMSAKPCSSNLNLWAVVHNADKTIPPVEDWLEDKEIDFDLVVPELFEAIPDSVVSSKNVKWLKDLMKKKTESLSPSTQSQSEQQPED